MKVPDGNSLETHGVEPVSTEEAQPVSVVEYYEMVAKVEPFVSMHLQCLSIFFLRLSPSRAQLSAHCTLDGHIPVLFSCWFSSMASFATGRPTLKQSSPPRAMPQRR